MSCVLFTYTGYLQDLGRMRINRSLLWDYFDKDPQFTVNHKARCNICQAVVLTSGNTSNLKHHLQSKHSDPDDNIFQQYLDAEAEKQNRTAASAEPSTSNLNKKFL